jgi:hypothetical protein
MVAGGVWAVSGTLTGTGSDPTPTDDAAAAGGPGSSGAVPAGASLTATTPSSSWDPSAIPNPCRTITSQQVSAIVGRPASTGAWLKSWPPLCRFTFTGFRGALLYVSDNALPSGKTDFDERRNGTRAARRVTGIGDDAYWVAASSTLHVMAGRSHISIIFAGPGQPIDTSRTAQALARIVVPQIGSALPPTAPHQ